MFFLFFLFLRGFSEAKGIGKPCLSGRQALKCFGLCGLDAPIGGNFKLLIFGSQPIRLKIATHPFAIQRSSNLKSAINNHPPPKVAAKLFCNLTYTTNSKSIWRLRKLTSEIRTFTLSPKLYSRFVFVPMILNFS